MKIQQVDINRVKENPDNPRTITESNFTKLVNSIRDFPEMLRLRPLVVNEDYIALGGNMRLRACKVAGMKKVWVIRDTDMTPEQQRRFIIADNVPFGEWDWQALEAGWDFELLGEWGLAAPVWEEEVASKPDVKEVHRQLTEAFVIPPFTVLDTRQGHWLERKRMWRSLIAPDGETREGVLSKASLMTGINKGTSIFDPVLAELILLWFGRPGCSVFDCFSGGEFGCVAAVKGHTFTGIELRPEQAAINNARVADFPGLPARYICDDGQNVARHLEPETQDLFFSCPPYYDLEVYSDLPNDASAQGTYAEFLQILGNAFSASIRCLANDRFAVVVVGDVRDKKGFYRGLPDDVKAIFKKNGVLLYNEMILVDPLGTLPQRAARNMVNRKVGKCHQNILVFYKGNPANIKANYPKLEMPDLQDEE